MPTPTLIETVSGLWTSNGRIHIQTARQSLRSLSRPPLSGGIVSQAGEAHMESMVLNGVVVRRSRDELTLTGRLRIGLVAAWVAVCVAIVLAAPLSVYLRIVMAAGMAIGIFTAIARARTRLVLRPTGFIVSGYDGLRRYQLAGPLAGLDVVGVVPMVPQFENMPYKDPDYFLQLVIGGRIVRAFRGLPRAELDEVVT